MKHAIRHIHFVASAQASAASVATAVAGAVPADAARVIRRRMT
ncbi:MAG: hypothetical protein ACO258_02750 [Burkholderiaceae bacterium]|jgi:hypothetical protein